MTLSVSQNSQPMSLSTLSEEKIELLKRTICKGASNDELELFSHVCNRTHLDPFSRQIYAIPREQWDNDSKTMKKIMTIQTGIDGYRLIAERTGKYLPGRECTFTYGKDSRPFSATAYVKKLACDGQWHEIAHTVYWEEYAAKKKDGTFVGMWKDKPHVMLGKCAEASALRRAFPADLSGIYTKEEMEQADIQDIQTKIQEQPQISVTSLQLAEELISKNDRDQIEIMLFGEDPEYRKDLLKYFSNAMKLETTMVNFDCLPRKYALGCIKAIQKRIEERLKKEAVKPTVDNHEERGDELF